MVNIVQKAWGNLKKTFRGKESSQPSFMDVIPDDVFRKIGSSLISNPKDDLKTKDTAHSFALVNKRAHALFQADHLLPYFLRYAAYGHQEKLEELFAFYKNIQELLCREGKIIDSAGREFHCTAYEYAYWAKDTHMCRMLERYMDNDTKSYLLKRCEAIEKNGLSYKHKGKEIKNSKHFDFTPLIDALKKHIKNYKGPSDWDASKKSWLEVGIAQRDLPAHVIHEYCRADRSFHPTPSFNEEQFPRDNRFLNEVDDIYPWEKAIFKELGTMFAITRNKLETASGVFTADVDSALTDLKAITELDRVSTANLSISLHNLHPLVHTELTI